MSAAYCKECLEKGADPFWLLRANVACCGGEKHVYKGYLESLVYVDGEYISLAEGLKKYPLTEQDLNFDPPAYPEEEKKGDATVLGDNGF